MAGPLATALITVGKNIVADIVTEPENILKYLFIALGVVLFVVILVFLPIALLLNFPLLVFQGSDTSSQEFRREAIVMYQNAPDAAEEKIMSWVEDVKTKNSYDDCNVDIDYDIDWRLLMIIDAVRLEQDFSKVKEKNVNNMAYAFADRNYSKKRYTDTVTKYRPKKDEDGNVIKDEDGNPVMEPYPDTVEKTRLVISVGTIAFEDVLSELNFSQKDFDAAVLMYQNIKFVDPDGNLLSFGGN